MRPRRIWSRSRRARTQATMARTPKRGNEQVDAPRTPNARTIGARCGRTRSGRSSSKSSVSVDMERIRADPAGGGGPPAGQGSLVVVPARAAAGALVFVVIVPPATVVVVSFLHGPPAALAAEPLAGPPVLIGRLVHQGED